jgi:hypothetical protein
MWRMIRGNRPFLLNREPVSTHRRLLHENGLAIVGEQARHNEAGLKRDQLAPRFRDLSEEDLTTESVFIQAVNSPG